MKSLYTYFQRFTLLLVAVQILNLSVYGKSFRENDITGGTNQIDSMVEFVTEIVLDHKNAFPENGPHNNHQSHTNHQLKYQGFNLINFRKSSEIKRYCVIITIPVPSKEDYKYLFAREINPPPPKA